MAKNERPIKFPFPQDAATISLSNKLKAREGLEDKVTNDCICIHETKRTENESNKYQAVRFWSNLMLSYEFIDEKTEETKAKVAKLDTSTYIIKDNEGTLHVMPGKYFTDRFAFV